MSEILRDLSLLDEINRDIKNTDSLFARIGGRPALEKVHKIFYDKIYKHEWIGRYFEGVDQKHIENQQSDFIAHLFGGPRNYNGRMPIDAHVHILVTEELYALRHELLKESLIEAGIGEKEVADWLKIDLAFKKVLLKDKSACKKRFTTDEILAFEPPKLPKAS